MTKDLPKVLFVDDQAEVLDDIKVIVAEVCEPYTALNAEEGIKVFENEGPFTIVASDQILPGMNGHIQRGGWLVADKETWSCKQRSGDRNALALTTRKLVRIFADRIQRHPHQG